MAQHILARITHRLRPVKRADLFYMKQILIYTFNLVNHNAGGFFALHFTAFPLPV